MEDLGYLEIETPVLRYSCLSSNYSPTSTVISGDTCSRKCITKRMQESDLANSMLLFLSKIEVFLFVNRERLVEQMQGPL